MRGLTLTAEACGLIGEATRSVLESFDGMAEPGAAAVRNSASASTAERPAMRLDDAGDLLTVSEVAGLLKISAKAVYARVERRQIPGSIRVGRSIRFHRVTIARWLERAVSSKEVRR